MKKVVPPSVTAMLLFSVLALLGCRRIPVENRLMTAYYSHKPAFASIISMLDEDHVFGIQRASNETAMTLNPAGPAAERDLRFSPMRLGEYMKRFKEIGLDSPAIVFPERRCVIFVLQTKGLAIGGGGTTRGIAYVAHPQKMLGYRVAKSVNEAESSSYGGVDLVPLEGNWYLYYSNPS